MDALIETRELTKVYGDGQGVHVHRQAQVPDQAVLEEGRQERAVLVAEAVGQERLAEDGLDGLVAEEVDGIVGQAVEAREGVDG